MDYIKPQIEFLKDYQKECGRFYHYWQNDEYVYIIIDRCAAFAIPQEHWLIQPDKAASRLGTSAGLEWILSKANRAKPARITGLQKVQRKPGRIIAEVQTEEALVEHIWIDQRYIKFLGKDYTLKATDSTSPVYFYDEEDRLLGFILPVRSPEQEKD